MANRYPTASESKTGSMRTMGYQHPGTVTRGPGKNRARVHLVSTGNKIPAGVYAEAIAARQKRNTAVNPSGTNGSKTGPNLRGAHTTQPKGVKPYSVKPKTGLT
jgi:hypothetical protein